MTLRSRAGQRAGSGALKEGWGRGRRSWKREEQTQKWLSGRRDRMGRRREARGGKVGLAGGYEWVHV